LDFRSDKKLITIADHATTEHILSFDVDFEMVDDLFETFELIVVFGDEKRVAEFRMFLILEKKS
jgi:hypothetical protein